MYLMADPEKKAEAKAICSWQKVNILTSDPFRRHGSSTALFLLSSVELLKGKM